MPKLPSLGPRVAPLNLSTVRVEPRTYEHGKLYGYRWQQERAAFLATNPLCVMCAARDRVTAATVVDHRIPHRGDVTLFWDRTNWQPLCAHHHNSTKQAEERGNTQNAPSPRRGV